MAGASRACSGRTVRSNSAKGAPSIEPFVVVDGKLVGWAEVEATQSLQDGYLPIPSVHWTHPGFALDITAFASQDGEAAHLHGLYTLTNSGTSARDYVFVLAVRPFQVNPPSQFLNTVGGISRLDALGVREGFVTRGGVPLLRMSQKPAVSFASTFDRGEVASRLSALDWSKACVTCLDTGLKLPSFEKDQVEDVTGLASGAMLFGVRLQPGESRSFDWRSLLHGTERSPTPPPGDAQAVRSRVAAEWHEQAGSRADQGAGTGQAGGRYLAHLARPHAGQPHRSTPAAGNAFVCA